MRTLAMCFWAGGLKATPSTRYDMDTERCHLHRSGACIVEMSMNASADCNG